MTSIDCATCRMGLVGERLDTPYAAICGFGGCVEAGLSDALFVMVAAVRNRFRRISD